MSTLSGNRQQLRAPTLLTVTARTHVQHPGVRPDQRAVARRVLSGDQATALTPPM